MRDRAELNLLTNLHPDKLLTVRQRYLIEEVGLDGHYLVSAACEFISRGMVDLLTADKTQRDDEMAQLLDFIGESLFDQIVASCEAHGFDDDRLHQIEFWLKEHLPELMTGVETIITEIYNILGNYSSPAGCQHPTIDRYFLGYSPQGDYGGVLHFYFKDNAF